MHGVQQHVRIAGDDHEQIVEVVGDAARQTSHGLQPLRMMELLFQAFSLGDVARIHHHSIDSGNVRKIARKRFQHPPRSITVTDAALHRPAIVAIHQSRLNAADVLGVNKRQDIAAHQFVRPDSRAAARATGSHSGWCRPGSGC